MKNTLRILLISGLIFAAFQPSRAMGQFYFMENGEIGKPAPDFTLPTVGGAATSFARFRGTDKAVIFFWATWCPHCRRELGVLDQKKEELARKGIKVALVDIGEEAATVKQYLQKNKVDMTVFLDKDNAVAESYNLVGVPTFLFVDAQGIVRGLEYSLPENYEEIFAEPALKQDIR